MKNPLEERVPAILNYVRKHSAAQGARDKFLSAWMVRGFALLMSITSVTSTFSSLQAEYRRIEMSLDQSTILSTISSLVLSLAAFGLLGILASTIHPVRSSINDSQKQDIR